jgi:hypothetical protein
MELFVALLNALEIFITTLIYAREMNLPISERTFLYFSDATNENNPKINLDEISDKLRAPCASPFLSYIARVLIFYNLKTFGI